jgi:hypothetical protein
MRPTRFALLVLMLVAAACSDSPVEPRSDPIDLATAFDELSMPALDAVGASMGIALPASARTRAGCAFDGSLQSFVCAPVTSGGLTINNSYTLLSASGVPQSAFDETTTDAVRTKTSVVGTLSSGTESMHIDDQRTSTLSGLLSGRHVIDGNGVTHLTGTLGTFPIDETITTTIAGLLPPLRGGNGYPRGGTVTTAIVDAGSTGFPGGSMTMAMTFDGTSKVAVTITSFGVTQHCTIDLASPTSRMACSG